MKYVKHHLSDNYTMIECWVGGDIGQGDRLHVHSAPALQRIFSLITDHGPEMREESEHKDSSGNF